MKAQHGRSTIALLGILAGVTGLRLAAVLAAPLTMTVYVVDGLARVRPSDPPGAVHAAVIKAARNEYEPFQVVVRAGEEGLKSVDVAASDLRDERGHVIPQRCLTLYREHYVAVTKPSPKSKEGAGWYPDALIPFLNPIDGKPLRNARFSAAPFEVRPNTNQPVWVDVFVPRGITPGDYSGTLKVTAEHHKPVSVPVKLTVWRFTLPESPSLRSNFGSFGQKVADAHKVDAYSAEFLPIERRYAEAMARHRLCPPIPNYLRPKLHPDGSIDPTATHDALKIWMEHFHITGFPIGLFGKDPLGQDHDACVQYLREMYAYLKANGWEKYAYIYVLDEPNDAAAYEQVRERADLIHEAQPGIKVLCTEQPTPQDPSWGSLIGNVDIWVPLWPLFEERAGAERLAAGEELWSYTALCQGDKGKDTPFWELDFPLLNYRIPTWMSWRYGMTGLLYWTTVYWQKAGDVWTNPLTYNQYNGEGSLFYPGTEAGFDGPVASMRLKQLREGMEDYEYFKLLADSGDRQIANTLVRQLAQRWTQWDADPAHLYAVRDRIAERLNGKALFCRRPDGLPESPRAPGTVRRPL